MKVNTCRVKWPRTVRLAEYRPLIEVIEDVSDPADWEDIVSGIEAFDPTVRERVGDLSKVPVKRRVSGRGATWVMAPFLHCKESQPTRFSDGTFGVYYAADRRKTAIAEIAHHYEIFMRNTGETTNWTIFQELIGSIDKDLDDVSKIPKFLDPNNYDSSQAFGKKRHAAGSNGIVYPSVRYPGGQCIALFWPDLVSIPKLGARIAFHWDGASVSAWVEK